MIRMYKPVLIYYDTLNFQEDTLMYLKKNFTLFTFSDPQHDTEEALQKAYEEEKKEVEKQSKQSKGVSRPAVPRRK